MNELITTAKETDVMKSIRLKFVKDKTVAILADISGSMWGSPIKRLREIMAGFTQYRRFVFSDNITELLPTEEVPEALGGTCMSRGFDRLKDEGVKHVVMITDGLPNNQEEALESSVGLKIDIIYVGCIDPPPEFLDKLAKYTGGTCGATSIHEVLKIGGAIKGLLAEAPKEAIKL